MSDRSKTRYFLIELVVNCLIFALSAAVCLNLFVSGYLQNENSRELSVATLESQNAAETIKSIGDNTELIINALGATKVGEALYIYYDEEWNKTSSEDSAFSIKITTNTQNGILTANILAEDLTDNEEIYLLEVNKYLEGEAD